MKNKTIQNVALLFCFLLKMVPMGAQNTLQIGEWKAHLPYNSAQSVTRSDDRIYYATPISIAVFDKKNNAFSAIEKTDGLSDVKPRLLKYDKKTNTLIVIYENSNLDLVRDGKVTNLNFIQKNINISGDKRVNDIFLSNDTAYLACGFGMLTLNLSRREFISTTFFPQNQVFNVTIFQNQVIAATEKGIFRFPNDGRGNIADFRSWQPLDTALGLPPQYRSHVARVFNQKLYFDCDDTLKMWQPNRPNTRTIAYDPDQSLQFLSNEGQRLVVGFYCKNNCDSKIFVSNSDTTLRQLLNDCSSRTTQAVEDEQNNIWIADQFRGFVKQNNSSGCTSIRINSVYEVSSTDFAFEKDGNVWVTYGGISGINPRFSPSGFSVFRQNSWKTFNGNNLEARFFLDSVIKDCHKIAISPKTGKVYVASFLNGLIELQNDKITKRFSETNSLLQTALGDPGSRRIGGIAFDADDNLWISNSFTNNPLVLMQPNGSMTRMRSGLPNQTFQVLAASNGYKWLISSSGLVVYDDKKTPLQPNDDRFKVFDGSNSVLGKIDNPPINAIAEDLDGRIWAATANGVVVFECGDDPFNDRCQGRQIIADLGGIAEYLLRQQNVTAVAVDGANRKWFGTSAGGIFVQNADGTKEVVKYNVSNSPLPSNQISALGIEPKSGIVWIGTANGLMSLRSDATTGGKTHEPIENIIAFPNPVRADYEGEIAIKGFARDANIKIMDSNGRLVKEMKALGGQVLWDGRDQSGSRVQSGVYYVFAANSKYPEIGDAIATKILIFRE